MPPSPEDMASQVAAGMGLHDSPSWEQAGEAGRSLRMRWY